MKDNIIYPANKQEDLERFIAAGERLVQRAKEDPEFARQILREIGYYEMMEDQRREEAEAAADKTARKAKRGTKLTKSKPVKDKV